ncbi:MAG: YebC/PmpR family DNA-binding transcriptional regulator [Nitrospira sp.]|nr:YebC/PmpR family DNA-binding transcriptional regulator [Nitrospira sp.]MDH4235730.1 YebC/PmpR family DNA-binding transcriptional regulator [Nitrospira sp.]MDH4327125.1 YebC/PmpR family DNA-binding transcriptional regulator [Nitrospira sp.]MDH5253418.1 YebC/PmpR family DNA-binding transcriptional regulator [Nitrospira sp.]MDH5625099.1 YebC/PmpR family DNA-binding transcriptional regulator [Nitrospira sp.]
MGGHSHWATIKRHKGAQDAKRGKIFTRIIREVTIAARSGGDPDGNPHLRLAIAKAKEANMPGDTLKKAIQRGTGELPGVIYEEFSLEGYGPGGTAVLLEITSDNRNRTVAEIRSLFTKNHGNMAEAGAVSWQFHKKGLLTVEKSKVEEDRLLSLALDAGAEDVKAGEKMFEIITSTHDFEAVKKSLADAKIETALAEITYIPQNTVRLEEKSAEQMLKLMEVMDEHDDVQKVHANFDIPDEVMEKVALAAG